MKFLDNIINKFFIDPLFSETRDGQKLNGYAEKQKYLQSKIDHLGENRTELISMSDKINILVESLDKKSNDLKVTKSKFQLLAENSVDVIWKTDFEYNTEYVSPSIFNLTGYTPEEFMQLHIKERHDLKTIDKLDKIFLDPSLRELTDTNETNIININGKIKHKDGRFIYIRIVCRPIFKGALFTGIQGTTSDTTDYVAALESLREREESFKALSDALSDASFEAIFISENNICTDQNQAAENMFGYTRNKAIGRQGIEWIAPEERGIVKKHKTSSSEKRYEVIALKKDGTKFPCEI